MPLGKPQGGLSDPRLTPSKPHVQYKVSLVCAMCTCNATCNETCNDTCTIWHLEMYTWHAKTTLLPAAGCEKRKTSDLLLVKCGLKRLGLSSLGQQAGVTIQHLLSNQESLSQCSQQLAELTLMTSRNKIRNTSSIGMHAAEQ